MGKDLGYHVLHRGEERENFAQGSWVFIQRRKEYGGGYWFGRAYDDCFYLEFHRPTSLSEGIIYLNEMERMKLQGSLFDDDFALE